jgi:carboxypeptidase Q
MQIHIRQYLFILFFPALLAGQEKVDLTVINRIKAEAFHHSTIMETAFYLTDVYGPRLTGSPALKEAADWSVKRMREFGLSNPRLESWGPFGRSWTNVNFCAHLRKPQYAPIIGMAKPWARSTEGPVSGQPVLAPMHAVADFAAYEGKLRGKIVMLEEPRILRAQSTPLMSRFSDAELAQRAEAPEPGTAATPYDPTVRAKFRNALNEFLNSEGAVLTISPSFKLGRTDPSLLVEGGTIFSSYAGSRKIDEPLAPPSAAIAAEDYNRIARLLRHNIPVTVEFDIENRLSNEELDSFSVIAEIPGSSKAEEVVMLGGHLDSMSFATGATDNAAGVAVVMEAMRILKKLDLKMPRTVRAALWTGEEQSFGSRPYVERHFFDPVTKTPKPEQRTLSGYFNLDTGTGKIRGAYLQGNDMMRPVFEAWFAPFRDLGVTTVTIANHSGSDETPFDEAGLPGFEFLQDPIEYETRTHHTNMDVYDRLQPPDLMQAAAVLASVVYHAATRPEKLPRKLETSSR